MKPKSCPVCKSEKVKPVLRSSSSQIETEREIISGVLAYRCSEGHVFVYTKQSQTNSSR